MNILIAIILFGLLFWKMKNNYIKRTTLACDYRIQEIGFKLDMLVANDKIKSDNANYRALRNNIVNMSNNMDGLNLLVLFIYFLRDRKKNGLRVAKPMANNQSISKKDQIINAELGKIEKEFNDIMFSYIIKKSVGLKFISIAFVLGVKPVQRAKNKLSAKLKDYLKYYIEIPLYRQTRLSPVRF